MDAISVGTNCELDAVFGGLVLAEGCDDDLLLAVVAVELFRSKDSNDFLVLIKRSLFP